VEELHTMRSGFKLAGMTVLAATLVGCGIDPATAGHARWDRPAPAADQVSLPVGVVGSPESAAPATGQTTVAALQAALRQTQASMKGFTASAEVFDKGPKGMVTESIKFAFAKPSTLKITVVGSSDGNKDAQLVWPGGDTIKVKPSYLPFSISLGMTDDRMVSKNGWPLKDTDVNAILRVLLDPAAQLTPLADQVLDGKRLSIVEVHSAQSPKGATREVIGVDKQTSLPALRMIYKGDTLMYRLTIKTMTLKAPSQDELKV
jgi:hypothetical protein